jgi:putative tryptophan/tyrosine transport system permease protein
MSFLLQFLDLVPVSLVQGLIYGLVAFGVMVPFRLLSFPDLTCEGSFPLGGCICGALIAAGAPPWLGIVAGAAGGFLAGCCTALVALRFSISSLLAGIIVVTMVYSVNLRVMGRSNIALFQFNNIFDQLRPGLNNALWPKAAALFVLAALVVGLVLLFLRTERGVAFRAVGANDQMARAQGISPWAAILGGVGAAGAFCGVAGALVVQSQGFADVNIGFGVLINGLAAMIIGELLVGRGTLPRLLCAPIMGSVIYFQIIALCLAAGLAPTDLKFATGLLVLAVLAVVGLRGGRGTDLARETVR